MNIKAGFTAIFKGYIRAKFLLGHVKESYELITWMQLVFAANSYVIL